jgi:hypothetical protein
MIRIQSRCGLFALITTATMLAGCGAGPEREAAPASPYPSQVSPAPTNRVPPADSPAPTNAAALPTVTRETAPPKSPTDALKKTDLVVGVVTLGGTGPCYGLQTDDGTQYALYSRTALKLTHGTYVKVHTKPATVRIFCGPGRFLEITKLEP